MAKTIRVGAYVNGRKSLDSKTCETVEEAFHNIREKILKYDETHTVYSVRLCAGELGSNKEFSIYHEGNDQLVQLVQDHQAVAFMGMGFSVSFHGLP
jgi:hypothetical protein